MGQLGQALVLGVVQGLTEFLPVSSSGHLVVWRALFHWPDQGLAFDAALHLGTLAAVAWYFRATWRALLRGREPQLLRALVGGTAPVAVAGLLAKSWIDQRFRSAAAVGAAFLVTAVALLGAEVFSRAGGRRGKGSREVSLLRALVVGGAQVAALLPGISRSGAAIAAGMLTGLSRARAVEFAFLLALPVLAGGGGLGLRSVADAEPALLAPLAVGFGAAFASGWAAIGFLLRAVRKGSLLPYAVYLAALGALLAGRGGL